MFYYNLSQFANTSVTISTRSMISAWYGIWSCFGTLLVLSVLIATIIQKRSHLTPVYVFLINLNVANLLMFIIYIIYVVPCVATGTQVYGKLFGKIFSACQSVTFSTIVQNTFLISINRSLVVYQSKLHDRIFTVNISKILTVATWFLSAIILYIDIALGCHSLFFENKFVFSSICTKISALVTFKAFVYYFCIYGVALFYILAIAKLWKTKKCFLSSNHQASVNMSKYQMNMFYQAACIWLSLLANAVGM